MWRPLLCQADDTLKSAIYSLVLTRRKARRRRDSPSARSFSRYAYETAGPDMAVIAINVGFNDSYLAATRPDASATCRSTREQFSALSGDPRLRWLGIASGLWANSQDLRQYRTQYKVTIPLTLDASGQVFRAFRVNEVPTVLIADAGGRIVRRIEGSAALDAAALRTAIDSL